MGDERGSGSQILLWLLSRPLAGGLELHPPIQAPHEFLQHSAPGHMFARSSMPTARHRSTRNAFAGRGYTPLFKVHVQLQIWRVAGQQTKSEGHTCLFSRDNGALLTRLPLLPSELDVLIIEPSGHLAEEQNAAFGCRPEFQVKRSRLLDNLTLSLPPELPSSRDQPVLQAAAGT